MTRRMENHTSYHAPPPGSLAGNNEGSGEQLLLSSVLPSPSKPAALASRQNFYSRLPSVEEQPKRPFKWSIFDSGPEDHDESTDDASTQQSMARVKTAFPVAVRPFREEAFDLEDLYPSIDGNIGGINRPLFVYDDFPEESELEKARNLALIAREEMAARLPNSRSSTVGDYTSTPASTVMPPKPATLTPISTNHLQTTTVLSSNGTARENHRPVSSQSHQQQQSTPLYGRNSTPISASPSSSTFRQRDVVAASSKQLPNNTAAVQSLSATTRSSPDSNVSNNQQQNFRNGVRNVNDDVLASPTKLSHAAPMPSEYMDAAESPTDSVTDGFSGNPQNADLSPSNNNQRHITAADVDGNLSFPAAGNDDNNPNAGSFDLFSPQHHGGFQPLFRRAGSDEIIIEEKPLRAKFIGPYLLGDVLGEGSYAKVKEAIDSRSLQRYAVKIFCQSKLKRIPNSREQVLTEISILKSLPTHRNICSMVDLREKREKHKLYLVMQLAVCGMQQLLEQLPQRRLPVWKAHTYFEQLMHAVDFIHSKSIIHKDIKPGNLVLDGHGVLKLIDFGVAQKVDPFAGDDLITTSQGSPAVQSPQVADGTDKFHGFKLDVWSCGVTLYNMVTGELPFNGDTVFELFDNIVNLPHTFPKTLKEDEPSLCDLIDRMLTKDELARFSVYQISQHAWVRRNCPFPAHSPLDHQIEEQIEASLSRPITTILPYVECYFRQRQAAAASQSQSPAHNMSQNSEVDDDMLINALGGDTTGVDIDRCEGVKFQREPRRHVSGAEAAVFAQMQGNYYAGESRMLREALPSPEVLRAVKSRDLNHHQNVAPDVNAFNFFRNMPNNVLRSAADMEKEEEDAYTEEAARAMQAEIEAGEFFDENDRKKQNLLLDNPPVDAANCAIPTRPSNLAYADTKSIDGQQISSFPPSVPYPDENGLKKSKPFPDFSFDPGESSKPRQESAVRVVTTPPDNVGASGPAGGGCITRSRQGSTASNKSSRVSAAAARHSQRQAPDQQMTWRSSPASSVRGGPTGSVGKIHHQVQYQHSTSVSTEKSAHHHRSTSQMQQSSSVMMKPSRSTAFIRGVSSTHYDTDDEGGGRSSRRAASISGAVGGIMQEPLLSPTPSVRTKKAKKVSGPALRAGSGESGSGGATRRMKKKGCNMCAIN